MLYVAIIGLVTSTFLAYAVPSFAWMADNKWAVLAASITLIAAQTLLASIGFHVGKWFNNAGSIAVLITVAVLIALPLVNARHGTLAAFHPLRWVAPPLTVSSQRFQQDDLWRSAALNMSYLCRRVAQPRPQRRTFHPDHCAGYRADLSSLRCNLATFPTPLTLSAPSRKPCVCFREFWRHHRACRNLSSAGELFHLQPLFSGSALIPMAAGGTIFCPLGFPLRPLQNARKLDSFWEARPSLQAPPP
jgi:hypothetical protein